MGLAKVSSITVLSSIALLFATIQCQDIIKIQKVYIKAVQCNGSSQYIYNNWTCFAKSYSRQLSTVNIRATLKKPMSDFFVRCYSQSNQLPFSIHFWKRWKSGSTTNTAGFIVRCFAHRKLIGVNL